MNKTLTTLAAFFLMSAVAWADDDYAPITSMSQFTKLLGNKTLTNGSDSFTVLKVGHASGKVNGSYFAADWRFQSGNLCQTLYIAGSQQDPGSYPAEGCYAVAVKGRKVKITANQGNGTARVWDIE